MVDNSTDTISGKKEKKFFPDGDKLKLRELASKIGSAQEELRNKKIDKKKATKASKIKARQDDENQESSVLNQARKMVEETRQAAKARSRKNRKEKHNTVAGKKLDVKKKKSVSFA